MGSRGGVGVGEPRRVHFSRVVKSSQLSSLKKNQNRMSQLQTSALFL